MRKYRFFFLKVVEGIKLNNKKFPEGGGGLGCWGHEASLELTESLKH